jgi:arylsulfatase A-like enzyme
MTIQNIFLIGSFSKKESTMPSKPSSRRDFIKAIGIGSIASMIPVQLFGKNNNAQRPNVILILTDDQGFGDTGIHSNEHINTPNIDRLAREGQEFTRFYVEPVCAPTRASLMTGRSYYRTGVIHTSRGGAKMAGDEVTLAELLRESGYRTGIFGKWHLGDNYPMRPQDQGFQETLVHRGGGITQTPDIPNSYFDPLLWKNGKEYHGKGYCTDIFFDAAIEFIKADTGHPFFIYLPTNTPHTPLQVSDAYTKPYIELGFDEPTARVYGMVKNIDDNLARLFEFLSDSKLDQDTLIIFISDNGPNTNRYNAGLRQRKSSNYEGGIRAISFWRWKPWQEGRKIDRIAAHIDVMPTLLDLCHVQKPYDLHLDGKSLLPLLNQEITQDSWPDRTLFLQCHRGLTPKRYQNCAAVSQRYKMVGYPGTFNDETLEPSLSAPELELYDLDSDPGEERDLSAANPSILARLRQEYESWFDSVEQSRQFTPGVIHLGNSADNPATLCRYQDSHYIHGIPHGWEVDIEKSGRYQLTIDRADLTGPGQLVVKWKGREQHIPLKSGENRGTAELSSGKGRLEIWFELEGLGRMTFSDNGTVGDVEIMLL